jgi:hypothetical protein
VLVDVVVFVTVVVRIGLVYVLWLFWWCCGGVDGCGGGYGVGGCVGGCSGYGGGRSGCDDDGYIGGGCGVSGCVDGCFVGGFGGYVCFVNALVTCILILYFYIIDR